MNRNEALDAIDNIRETLGQADHDRTAGIVRDLHDGYPIEDAADAARDLLLNDYQAEVAIRAIVAQVTA